MEYILRTAPNAVCHSAPAIGRRGRGGTHYSTDRAADPDRNVLRGSQTRLASGLDSPLQRVAADRSAHVQRQTELPLPARSPSRWYGRASLSAGQSVRGSLLDKQYPILLPGRHLAVPFPHCWTTGEYL